MHRAMPGYLVPISVMQDLGPKRTQGQNGPRAKMDLGGCYLLKAANEPVQVPESFAALPTSFCQEGLAQVVEMTSAGAGFVFLVMYSLSYGWRRRTCTVSIGELERMTRLGRTTVKRALRDLLLRKLVVKEHRGDPKAAKATEYLVAEWVPGAETDPGPKRTQGQNGPTLGPKRTHPRAKTDPGSTKALHKAHTSPPYNPPSERGEEPEPTKPIEILLASRLPRGEPQWFEPWVEILPPLLERYPTLAGFDTGFGMGAQWAPNRKGTIVVRAPRLQLERVTDAARRALGEALSPYGITTVRVVA